MKKVIILTREVTKRTQWRKWRYKGVLQAVAVVGGEKHRKIIASSFDAMRAYASPATRIPFEKTLETDEPERLVSYLADLSRGWGENAEELKRFEADVLEAVK